MICNSKKPNYAYKAIAYTLFVPSHCSAMLTHDCVVRKTTEWLFQNFYVLQYELGQLILQIILRILYKDNVRLKLEKS